MSNWLPFLPYLVFWAVSMQAILVWARIVPPSCVRCGRPFERRYSDQPVCTCCNVRPH